MPRKKTTAGASPGRTPHVGRRPKARVIGPDVLCAQPRPPRRPRGPKAKKPPAIVKGPPVVPPAPAPSIKPAVAELLKEEDLLFSRLDVFQTVLFAGAAAFFFRGVKGLGVFLLAAGALAPMVVRRLFAAWRNKYIGAMP